MNSDTKASPASTRRDVVRSALQGIGFHKKSDRTAAEERTMSLIDSVITAERDQARSDRMVLTEAHEGQVQRLSDNIRRLKDELRLEQRRHFDDIARFCEGETTVNGQAETVRR